MSDQSRIDAPTGTATVGHEWDGIEELNTPLPRWWLLTFYATVAWAAVYVVLYPAWPMISDATGGTLGWTSRGQLREAMTAETERRAPMLSAIAATPANALPANEKLMNFAIQGGSAAFKVHCIQCHGSGATGGGKAYPSLADDDWLWGGDMASIEYSIVHGIRNPDHAETRISQMPAFGRDGILDSRAITDVVSHVRFVSGQEKASASSARGAKIFADNCAVCHGPTAGGDRAVGAPNLRDGIWQYGGDRAAITASVTNSRQGVMPRWGNRLDPATIRMLAAYVHSRGGGEAAPAALPVAAASPAAGGAATP